MHQIKTLRAAVLLLILGLSAPFAASAQAQTLPGGDWSLEAEAAGAH